MPQVLQNKVNQRKILSEGAKRLIREQHLAGAYKNRAERLEPPYMPPSEDPDDYSKVCALGHSPAHDVADGPKWCSTCNDFGSLLVLCAGCRVAICVKTRYTLSGCVEWHGSIEHVDFIYYCPYCGRTLKMISPVCVARSTTPPNLISYLPAPLH
jgi:hypothetical protein